MSSTFLTIIIVVGVCFFLFLVLLICCTRDNGSNSETTKTTLNNQRQQPQVQPQPQVQLQSRPQVQQQRQVQRVVPQRQNPSSEESSDEGIYIADESSKYKILQKLYNTQPNGQTSLRDAIVMGILKQLFLKLYLLKRDPTIFQSYKFISIVLTDGEDTKSKVESHEMKSFFYRLQDELGDACETFLIGVGLDRNAQAELSSYQTFGKGTVHFENVNDVNIEDIFERIQVKIGIRTRAAMISDEKFAIIATKKEVAIDVNIQRYVILFSLDMSGSMSGGKWRRVTQAMTKFLETLKETDIFCCMLFNEHPKFL